MRRNKGRRIAAILLGLLLAVSAGTCAYAFEGGTYHDFRDGDITLYLPDGWSSNEIAHSESEDRPYERIADAWDDKAGGTLRLSIYYLMDDALQDDYVYFDDDEVGAMEYFENYGRNAIDTLYAGLPEAGGSVQAQWSQSDPVFFNGEWNGFLTLHVTGSPAIEGEAAGGFVHTVYLTAKMADDSEKVVHNVLVFYRQDGAALMEGELTLAREIADEFYDYDYANVMAGVTDDGDWNWDGDDPPDGGSEAVTIILGILGILTPIITILIILIAVRRAIRRRKETIRSAAANAYQGLPKEIKEVQQSFDLDDTINEWKKHRAEKESFSGKEQRTEQRAERRAERREDRAERRSTMQMRTREAESAEQRYYESLQTLHKTGLLTKAEMRDMLERHERSRARQRNRR